MKLNLKKFYHSNSFVMSLFVLAIISIIVFFIIMFSFYGRTIGMFLNFKVFFPEPDTAETLYYDSGRDSTFIEKWTYSPKKMSKFIKNKDVKKIDVDKVNQIFDILVENGRFRDIEIVKKFDKRLINESNYYAVKIDSENGLTEDVSNINFRYMPAYFVLIADVETNEVYIFEAH